LQDLAATHDRIFLVSHNAEQVDPNGNVETWLRANTIAANDYWAGAVRVIPFVPLPRSTTAVASGTTGGSAGTDAAPDPSANAGTNAGNDGSASLDVAAWQDGPTLEYASASPGGRATVPTAGGAVVVTLRWAEVGDTPLKASLQLLAPDGSLVAQEDRDLSAGEQQFVLLIPRSAAAADYRLGLVLYDPAGGRRLATTDGTEMAQLGAIPIVPAAEPARLAFPPLRHPDDADDEGS
jgi:hypothetical protein